MEFKQLKMEEQLGILTDHSEYLMSCVFYDYRIHLMSLHGAFIEIWWNAKLKKVHKVIVVEKYHELDKFTQYISIKSIL
jgi:hypothetical protein